MLTPIKRSSFSTCSSVSDSLVSNDRSGCKFATIQKTLWRVAVARFFLAQHNHMRIHVDFYLCGIFLSINLVLQKWSCFLPTVPLNIIWLVLGKRMFM
jgi:hypothetical protein